MSFRPRHPLPSWEWPVAGFAHVAGFALVILSQCGSTEAPLFRPQDAIMVQLAGPPAQESRMPTRAERAPDPTRGAQSPDAPPPPPNASDLSLPTPDPTKGNEKADVQREALMEQLRREELLRDMAADVGKTDRLRTDADASSSDGASQRSGVVDPQLAKWVKAAEALINKNFHPLPTLCAANPSLEAVAVASIALDGTIEGEAQISETSGTASIDAACVRAFAATGKLPPTPANHPEGINGVLTCRCPK